MNARSRMVMDVMQLMRVDTMLAAISGAWVMIFFAKGLELPARPAGTLGEWSLGGALALGAVAAGGLHVFSTAINDALDVRHDRVFSPQRPLAAGRLSLRLGVSVGFAGLVLALLGAMALGVVSTLLCLGAAVGFFFYSAAGKYIPGLGIAMLGLIRVGVMLIPNPSAAYLWPVWVALTHVIIVSAVAYRWEGKRPQLEDVHWWVICLAWLGAALALMQWMRVKDAASLSQGQGLWLGPAAAGFIFVLTTRFYGRSKGVTVRSRRAGGRTYGRFGLYWLIVYDLGWMVSAGWYGAALCHAALLGGALAMGKMLSWGEALEQEA